MYMLMDMVVEVAIAGLAVVCAERSDIRRLWTVSGR